MRESVGFQRFIFASAATLTIGFSPGTGVAQQNDESNDSSLEMVVVTARKRSESIQDTPIAISAFGNQELRAAAHDNIVDVSRAAPGLFIETVNSIPARVDASPRFRGVTFESTSPLQRTGSIFIDGILVSGGIQSIGVQELERVEIIKGPQSALFGRNTFSGAINYVTKLPSEEFQGNLSVLGASRGEYRFSASAEGSLSDTWTGRVSASFSNKDGHYNNSIVPGQDLGDEESASISGTLVFEPNDDFRLRLRGNYYEDDDGPAAVVLGAGFADHNFGGFPLGDGFTETAFRGTVPVPDASAIGLDTGRDIFDLVTGAALNDAAGRSPTFLGLDFDDLGGFGMVREGYRVAADASYAFNNGMTLEFLTGINEDEFFVMTDFEGSPGHAFTTTGGRKVEDFSFEGRLAGTAFNDRLDWSVGANRIDIDVESTGGFYDGVLGFWFPGVFEAPAVTSAETTGLFATADWAFNDQFTLILEARYQEDEIADENVNAGLATPISPTVFYSFLPRVLLQYQPNDDTMLYFNYSEGNLPGGFNDEVGELDAAQLAEFRALVPGVSTSFDEETLTNYEIGWKQTTLDGDLAFNLAVFMMERSDQIFSGFELVSDPDEVNGVRTVAFTANGATTDIEGFELDATWLLSDRFSLQGSLAYVNAEIASFPPGANSGDFTAVFGPDADVTGQTAPRFPEWAGSLSGTYERPTSIWGGGDWYTRADIFYTGEFFDENTNLAVLPEAWDVNLRTGLRKENWSLEFFVTNLFDEDAPIAGNNIADTSLAVRFGSGLFDFSRESVHIGLRDKRQFGLRLDYRF
ncbi:MAG: TonB-dependent receptor [Pseudomonadota bacterium]